MLYQGQTAVRNDSYQLYEKPTTPRRTMPPSTTKKRLKTTKRPANATGTPGTPEPPEVTESTERPTTTTADPLIKLWKNKNVLMFLNCNTTFLPQDLYDVFPHVKTFVIWFSGLVYFDAFILRLMILEEINFQDNEISFFPDNSFDALVNLTSLNLGGNKLKSLPEKMVGNNRKLLEFLAHRNQIEALPAKLFSNNTRLVYVNLNNNRIKYISIDFTTMKSIQKILGMQNDCADFFLTKRFNAVQLNELVRAKCAPPPETTTTLSGH